MTRRQRKLLIAMWTVVWIVGLILPGAAGFVLCAGGGAGWGWHIGNLAHDS